MLFKNFDYHHVLTVFLYDLENSQLNKTNINF